VTRDRVEPRDPGKHVAEGTPAGAGAVAFHGGHVDHDELGLDRACLLGADPPALELVATEVARHRIGNRDQPPVPAFGQGEVEGAGQLARVHIMVEVAARVRIGVGIARQLTVKRHAVAAGRVHAVAGLDADHLGTEVGQHPQRQRPGDHPGEIDDPHARKRLYHTFESFY
jgi:hypothetical protein